MVFEYVAYTPLKNMLIFWQPYVESLILRYFYCVEKIALAFRVFSVQNVLNMSSWSSDQFPARSKARTLLFKPVETLLNGKVQKLILRILLCLKLQRQNIRIPDADVCSDICRSENASGCLEHYFCIVMSFVPWNLLWNLLSV